MKRSKRNLAQELMQGLEELRDHRKKKITLRSTKIEAKEPVLVTAEKVKKVREFLNLSQGAFALKLRISQKTLQKWEQSKTPIKGPAALLIALAEKYPDTIDRINRIEAEA